MVTNLEKRDELFNEAVKVMGGTISSISFNKLEKDLVDLERIIQDCNSCIIKLQYILRFVTIPLINTEVRDLFTHCALIDFNFSSGTVILYDTENLAEEINIEDEESKELFDIVLKRYIKKVENYRDKAKDLVGFLNAEYRGNDKA